MQQQSKKNLFSGFMAVVIAVCAVLSPVLSVSADVIADTIAEGEDWRDSWQGSSETGCVIFEPEASGFYTLSITDFSQTSSVFIEITDITTDQPYKYIFQSVGDEPYVTEKMLMSGGHKYELLCYYSGYDYSDSLTADLSLRFDKLDYNPMTLPYRKVAASNMQVIFEPDTKEWFSFTTDKAGDYSFNYSNEIDAYVEVYNAETGELIDARYTPYLFEYYEYSMWLCSEQLVFTLDADTEYYFCVEEYRQSTTKLSISKNSRDIKDITINSLSDDIDWLGVEAAAISEAAFFFDVLYSDGITEKVDYYDAVSVGIQLPYIEYIGKTVNVNGLYLPLSNKQPIFVYYNGSETVEYVTIPSISDTLIESGYGAYNEFDGLPIWYEDNDEYFEYWRIKVEKTGLYKLCNSEKFSKIFTYYGAVLIDEQNNIIHSTNDDKYYWPLVADREYVLCFKYCYSEDYTNDLYPYISKESGTLYPDTYDDWYYDAVAYVSGRNIMTGYGSNGYFGTADSIQRQDFLVMLARLDGVDLTQYRNTDTTFPDVPKGSYYEAAIMWGYENGIVSGYQNGKFGVGDKITREQLVTFLYRYAGYKNSDTSYQASTKQKAKKKYTDFNKVTDYAVDPVLWAIENGVIRGKTDTTIVPDGNALRCEVAQIMYNIFNDDVF